MKTNILIAGALLATTSAAVAASSVPKSIPSAVAKKFTDLKNRVKPVTPKTKPATSAVKMPGNPGVAWCGIAVATGQFICESPAVECPSVVLLVSATGGDYRCEVDCHGQVTAGSDGTCDCDIKYDTCKVEP